MVARIPQLAAAVAMLGTIAVAGDGVPVVPRENLRLEVVPKQAKLDVGLDFKNATPTKFWTRLDLRLAVRYPGGMSPVCWRGLALEEATGDQDEKLELSKGSLLPPGASIRLKPSLVDGRPAAGEFEIRLPFLALKRAPNSVGLKGHITLAVAKGLAELAVEDPSRLTRGARIKEAPAGIEIEIKDLNRSGIMLRLRGDTEDHIHSVRFLDQDGKEIKSRGPSKGLDHKGVLWGYSLPLTSAKKMVLVTYKDLRWQEARLDCARIDLCPPVMARPAPGEPAPDMARRGVAAVAEPEEDIEVRPARPGEIRCQPTSLTVASRIDYDGSKPKKASRTLRLSLTFELPKSMCPVSRGPVLLDEFRIRSTNHKDLDLAKGWRLPGNRYRNCMGVTRDNKIGLYLTFDDIGEVPTMILPVRGSFVLRHSEYMKPIEVTGPKNLPRGALIDLAELPDHKLRIKEVARRSMVLGMDEATHERLIGVSFYERGGRAIYPRGCRCRRNGDEYTHSYGPETERLKKMTLLFRKAEKKGLMVRFELKAIPLTTLELGLPPVEEDMFF